MKTEIIEGNFLISKAMGYTYPSANSEIFRLSYDLHNYHEDWNKLMPVVEKIEQIDGGVFNFSVLYKQGLITSNRVNFTIKGLPKRNNISVTSTSTKEAVWLTIVEFYKWYNQNNNQ
jgi:hypothetical protein